MNRVSLLTIAAILVPSTVAWSYETVSPVRGVDTPPPQAPKYAYSNADGFFAVDNSIVTFVFPPKDLQTKGQNDSQKHLNTSDKAPAKQLRDRSCYSFEVEFAGYDKLEEGRTVYKYKFKGTDSFYLAFATTPWHADQKDTSRGYESYDMWYSFSPDPLGYHRWTVDGGTRRYEISPQHYQSGAPVKPVKGAPATSTNAN